MRLFLVRHGQTAWNFEQRAQGHFDTELDATGRRQAIEVAQALSEKRIERVLSSDLKRSVQTAEPIARAVKLPLELTKLLRERSFGSMEGQPYDEVRASIEAKAVHLGVPTYEAKIDGGESLQDVWKRLDPVIEGLDHRDTVVVSHGGALGLLLAKLIVAGPEAARSFRFANASITELFRRNDGGWSIDRLNDRAHLEVAREGFGTGA